MTAIADLDAYRATLDTLGEPYFVTVGSLTATAGRWYDLWRSFQPAGTFPTTSAVPTNATTGSVVHQDGGSGQLWITGARMNGGFGNGVYMIVDRLVHQGGLSGTVTTAQTTNLPTSALTRHTGGDGVMMGLTFATAVGTTATTVSCSYTNQAGTAGRTAPLVAFGGTGFREQGRLILLPLQVGDTGVRSVESVTVTATTGTAGNFGVVMFKPLYVVVVEDNTGVCVADYVTGYTAGGIPEVIDGACLSVFSCMTNNPGGAGSLLVSEV